MLLPPIWWAALTIFLKAAFIISYKDVSSGMTIKVTVDTIQKVCATVYEDQESALATHRKSHQRRFYCSGKKCMGGDDSKSMVLHLCQDTNTFQQVNMNPGDDLSSLDTKDKKVSGNVSQLLSELQTVIQYIESVLEGPNEAGLESTAHQYSLDTMVNNLSNSLGELQLIDPRKFQHSILLLLEGNKNERLNIKERGTHSNKVINNVLTSLRNLNHIIMDISDSQQPNQRILAARSNQAESGSETDAIHHEKNVLNEIDIVPGTPSNQVNSGTMTDTETQNENKTVKEAPLGQVNLDSKTNEVLTKEKEPTGISTGSPCAIPVVNQESKKVLQGLETSDSINNVIESAFPQQESYLLTKVKQAISQLEGVDMANKNISKPKNLEIDNFQRNLNKLNEITKDLITLISMKKEDYELEELKEMQNLGTGMSDMGTTNGVDIEKFTKIIYEIFEYLLLIIKDLQMLQSANNSGTDELPYPPHSNVTNLQPTVSEKVLDHNLRDVIKLYTQYLNHIQKIGNDLVVSAPEKKAPPALDDSKKKKQQNEDLISVFQTEVEVEQTLQPPPTLNDSFYDENNGFIEEQQHIPELIKLLESEEIEASFWIPEFGDTLMRNETHETLDQVLVHWNEIALTQVGYHKIAKLICIMLRLLEKGLVSIDLMKYIKYFYWILDTQREGAMKSGASELLKNKKKVLPEGDNPVDTLVKTIKGPLFRDGYWIPEHGGTEKMGTTIATLTEIFQHGEKAVKSISDVSKIMCILITLQDTGLINLKQVELDRMIKYLFPILENMISRGKDHVPYHTLQKVDGSYNGTYSDYFIKSLFGKDNNTTKEMTNFTESSSYEEYIDIR